MNKSPLVMDSHATPLGRSTDKKDLKLSSLPLELLFDILDHLPWAEKVSLAQTCRDFWSSLHPRCASIFRDATFRNRVKYLNALSSLIPDHYYCPRCYALHSIDSEDVPVLDEHRARSDIFCGSRTCPNPESPYSRRLIHPNYGLAFRHIQLAIKYSRLKNTHQTYRASILQKFTTSTDPSSSPEVQFTAEPRVRDGRFIIKTIHRISDGEQNLSMLKVIETRIRFCPHHSLNDIQGLLYRFQDPMLASIDNLINLAPQSSSSHARHASSCDQCPTDYKIKFTGKELFVSTWQDLGTGICAKDHYWQSHDWISGFSWDRSSSFPPYEHGSIERLFNSGKAVPKKSMTCTQ